MCIWTGDNFTKPIHEKLLVTSSRMIPFSEKDYLVLCV